MEEQRLADRCLHSIFLEGLWNQVGRLRALTSQQAFGEGRDENDRHVMIGQNVVGGINTGRSICKLDVTENQSWRIRAEERERFAMRGCDTGDCMAEVFDQTFKICSNNRLILNYENFRSELAFNFSLSILFENTLLFFRNSEDVSCVRSRKSLKGCQQESLPLDGCK